MCKKMLLARFKKLVSMLCPLQNVRFVVCFCVLSATALLFLPSAHGQTTQSPAWETQIFDEALPARVVAVDKNQQQFYLFEKKSPLKLSLNYPCTTGQVEGDKQKINDKKTPEGVYFVEYKISSGLDFKEYGGIAYTLNYPNPVDKLRGKTGYGIWIHSKGEGISPRITRGCIALDLDNIAEVGPLLTPGTPVVVADSLVDNIQALSEEADEASVARHLRLRMEQWTRAWASRSEDFFEFYNQAAYTRAMPESFKAFRANKERLFKILKWINIFNREVYTLKGPGYWVTWSEQFYRAPNLSTEGIRRLYWQRGEDKQFRIVGMEWIPRNVGMQAAYEKGQLVARAEDFATDAGSALELAQVQGDDPVQGEKPLLPPLLMPEQAVNEQADNEQADTEQISPLQAEADVQAAPDTHVQTAQIQQLAPHPLAQATTRMTPTNQEQSTNAGAVSETERKTLQKHVLSWAGAWQKLQLQELITFYDSKHYGSVTNLPHKQSYTSLKAELAQRVHLPWVEIMQNPARVERSGKYMTTRFNQWIYAPGKLPSEGERTLYWQQSTSDKPATQWRIVGSHWEEKKLDMSVLYLGKISDSVKAWVQDWRKDWLAAEIDTYATHYAPHARQAGRTKTAMLKQKRALWQKAAPATIQLHGIRVQLDKDGIRVDMTQVYKDKNGSGDKGVKTLILQPYSKAPGQRTWRIVREEWEEQ